MLIETGVLQVIHDDLKDALKLKSQYNLSKNINILLSVLLKCLMTLFNIYTAVCLFKNNQYILLEQSNFLLKQCVTLIKQSAIQVNF